jgi:hypothetical protein
MHQVQNKKQNLPPYVRPKSPPPAFDSSKSHDFFPYGTGGNESNKSSHTETVLDKPSPKKLEISSSRPNSIEIKIPPIPESFPELKNLSENQLKRLLNDEMALQVSVITLKC